MDRYFSLATVILSGLFALAVNVVSSWLSERRDSKSVRRQLLQDRKLELRNLYADNIALFEKYIRYTLNKRSVDELYMETAVVNSRMMLMSIDAIILQSERVSEALFNWSAAYMEGSPKTVGDTGHSIISNKGLECAVKAKGLYEVMETELKSLVLAMREQLHSIDE